MNKNSAFLPAALLATALAGASLPALAQDAAPTGPFGGNISGSITLGTDYVFRGLSQTDDNPTVQGGLEFAFPSNSQYFQPYIGVWASNVDFGVDESIEVDYYAGFGGESAGFTYGASWLYYSYPDADNNLNYDYWELAANVGYDLGVAAPEIGYAWSEDFFGNSGDAHYLYGAVAVPLPFVPDLSVTGTIGHQWIETNAAFGVQDYLNWSIVANYSAFTLDFALGYYDTDLSKVECFGGATLCDARAVFTVSKAL